MDFSEVPNILTPCFLRTPFCSNPTVKFSPVWPPIPGIIASGFSFSIIFSTDSTVNGSMYTISAVSGSVCIVAGLELTSTTLWPASLNAEQHCDPE